MSKKSKLKLNDLNVTSFKTSEEIQGGALPSAAFTCIKLTIDRHCSRVKQTCDPILFTEGYETVCQTVKTVDNIECNFNRG